MDRLYITNYAELSSYIYELAKNENKVVATVLFFNGATELLKWLMSYEDIEVGSIDIQNEDYSGYDKEYYITLDTDLILDIMPAYKYGEEEKSSGYSTEDFVDVFLYDGDASSKIYIINDCQENYELVIEENSDACSSCCEDCSNCSVEDMLKTLAPLWNLLNHLGD